MRQVNECSLAPLVLTCVCGRPSVCSHPSFCGRLSVCSVYLSLATPGRPPAARAEACGFLGAPLPPLGSEGKGTCRPEGPAGRGQVSPGKHHPGGL